MTSNKKIVILAIDPGIYHCGYSKTVVDTTTGKGVVPDYGEFSAISLAKKHHKTEFASYGNVIPLKVYAEEIERIFLEYDPDYVVCESAFIHKFPQAYASLCLCLHTIERVLYSHGKTLAKIAPREAKKAIGDASADKLAVQDAIHKLPDLEVKHTKDKPLEKMSEHQADSIAIGYAFKKKHLNL